MKIKKKCKKGSIEDCIEAPSTDPLTTRPSEMVVQHQTRDQEAENELENLTIGHQSLPRRPDAHRTQQIIPVHQHVDRSVGHQRYREQRLRGREPQVAHHHHHRVVVHVEEGEPPVTGSAQEDQQGVDEFEDLGEVEHVGPEEGGSSWRGVVEWEANGPAEVVGRRLVEGGEGAADDHEEGEEAEDEVVGGGDEAERGGRDPVVLRPAMEPTGTIVFTSVGRPYYGFDIFSVNLPSTFGNPESLAEARLTDGVSINFNGQFSGEEGEGIVYISERTGLARIYLNRTRNSSPEQLHSPPGSPFHDRPFVRNGRLYFISAHEPPEKHFSSWSALYSTELDVDEKKPSTRFQRLTPCGCVDYSPSISRSGKLIAVASYGSRRWGGEFHHLQTDIVVFSESEPSKRVVLSQNGGWPTWAGDSAVYFHRLVDDGWWSIFRVDLPHSFESSAAATIPAPVRITPPGVHCFTPAAMHNNPRRIAVATRRKGKNYRHIEIFELDSKKFYPVTESLNPNCHHYNPFVSVDSTCLGYHRFRGESESLIVQHIEPVISPVRGLQMIRLNGTFPTFSPSGDLIAFNHDFDHNSGLKIVKSDGSKRWTLFEKRITFYNSWSPVDNNVIFTSIGPIFESEGANVQIARVTFDPSNLTEDVSTIPVDIKILTREGTGNNAFPSCSPDGKSIVFRSGRSGHKNLYLINAVDGEFDGRIQQITEGPWIDTMPSWSPDGKLIAFSSNRHNVDSAEGAFGLYVMKPDGGGVTRIPVSVVDQERERLNHVCFSGDSEWLLFASNLAGITVEPVSLPNHFQPYGDLYLVRLDGSGLRRLTWNGYENGTPAWHPKALLPMVAKSSTEDECAFGFSRLSLRGGADGDKLKGQFEEPLWIRCDI
ncbi:hypothetical protein F511_04704 [Dorcoceras hygrometricum]|uniref:Uncharacterized protein n=1 Tax=Dorcoceras hygrometricum TaxID=472368 RepID=A0A2Z7AZC9_9LAMI|nr:hypothetical protein F511_04704 [Dorcoceras hygrometricum]